MDPVKFTALDTAALVAAFIVPGGALLLPGLVMDKLSQTAVATAMAGSPVASQLASILYQFEHKDTEGVDQFDDPVALLGPNIGTEVTVDLADSLVQRIDSIDTSYTLMGLDIEHGNLVSLHASAAYLETVIRAINQMPLVKSGSAFSDSAPVPGTSYLNYDANNNLITGSSSTTDILVGGDGNDILYTNGMNDILAGEGGNDAYVVKLTGATITLDSSGNGDGVDRLFLADRYNTIGWSVSNDGDLTLNVTGKDNVVTSIVMPEWYSDNFSHVSSIHTYSGDPLSPYAFIIPSVFDESRTSSHSFYDVFDIPYFRLGTDKSETIYGSFSNINEALIGYGGHDTLHGWNGDDTIYGDNEPGVFFQ
jgi:Ca2+-binding RTX toxin-like protein